MRLVLIVLCSALMLSAGTSAGSKTAGATYTKDIAPILFARCTGCHRPGEVAPMSLLTYSEVRPWAKAIQQAVVTRKMPPWGASGEYGHFSNDPRLSDAEIETIRDWVKAGAPEGDPALMPAAPHYVAGWRYGEPDLVIPLPQDFQIDATGPDEYVDFVVDPGFKQDMWVQMAELRPGNRRIVHHAHIFLEGPAKPGESTSAQKIQIVRAKPSTLPVVNDGCSRPEGGMKPGEKLGELSNLLASYVPGKDPEHWPRGIAKRIPAGSRFRFSIHYSHTTGKPESDRTSIGLYFAPGPPEHELHRLDMHNLLFEIPAGAPDQQVTACYTFTHDIDLLSYVAHMHLRGKDMRFDAFYPDGRTETLADVPQYRFEWQMKYINAEPVRIPAGTRIKITAHFDNSANNAENPDPTKTVRWGESTHDEMMDGWLEFIDAPASARK